MGLFGTNLEGSFIDTSVEMVWEMAVLCTNINRVCISLKSLEEHNYSVIKIEFWIYESGCEYNVINKIYGLVSKCVNNDMYDNSNCNDMYCR